MILIKTPSLALHSYNVPGYKYKLGKTVMLPAETSVWDLVGEILTAAAEAPNGFLENVVINSHGLPGGLLIGRNHYLNYSSAYLFGVLDNPPSVGTIWLVACEVAKSAGGGEGFQFCRELAYEANAAVVAGRRKQRVNAGLYLRGHPDNRIDRYEGPVYRFTPDGKCENFDPPFN